MNKTATRTKLTPLKKKRKPKRQVDPKVRERVRQRLSTRAVFQRIGFDWIKSDDIQFTFDGRTGEIDDILVFENVLVIAEYTTGKPDSGHLARKSILYEKILKQPGNWIAEYAGINESFSAAMAASKYQPDEFQLFVCYASLHGADQEIETAFPHYRFLDGTRLRYFDALSKTIQRSAKHEFFNYLGVNLRKLGSRIHSTEDDSKNFSGYLLPESNSGYQRGFKVVSFYADPATLLEMSYVLRKDSWRDPDGLYQRILIHGKIKSMRRYLTDAKRVFVNNIIVTLPPETVINDPTTGKNADNSQLVSVTPVKISIPRQASMIGLIDGQHRVFSYHDAPKDPLDAEIAKQRMRQNLLVTGLIFPTSWTRQQKREFEAKLFLEINDTQARAKTLLKQSIEVLLNPFSTLAIAKEVINRMSRSGPLNGLLQTNFFDPPDRIKTSSIVSYGLRPLVKTDGDDSLYAAWSHKDKALLTDRTASQDRRNELLHFYIEFCAIQINEFLIEAKMAIGPDKWRVSTPKDRQILGPTVVNGFFVCIRQLVESGNLLGRQHYAKKLTPLATVNFSTYTSSAWKSLGDKLFELCF
ncbi:DGQHR domain-containing protein [Polaromonas sp. UBA4122]|uniref:DGQHR domain-containing protein n=1 Tax=Polaromonas sp. UBA4122 TaxID=1947074 RepID=UPI0025F5ED7E|nr:DGQHR domain-containing protein [Polaromonas sp. UBA4122]